jgi:putative transposase
MKRKRYTEEQIIRILSEIESGQTVAETCRKYTVSESAVYRWRQKYRGMDRQSYAASRNCSKKMHG